MKNFVNKSINVVVGIFLVASLLRLPYLSTIPPLGVAGLIPRIITALMSIVTIGLLMYIVHKKTRNLSLTYASGLAFALMPWHIEQSRIVSPPMWALLVVLLTYSLVLQCNKTYVKLAITAFAVLVLTWVYPGILSFTQTSRSLNVLAHVSHFFRLISIQFHFFQNDSFWKGGLREWGVLLPTTLPIFLLGLFQLLKSVKWKHWGYGLYLVVIWLIAALNPLFPEGREFFLITPYISIIIGLGIIKLLDLYKYSTFKTKALLGVFFLFVIYEHLIFAHFYLSHYVKRIQYSIPYEERAF